MVMLDSARRKTPVPALARWLLSLGIASTPAANVGHGLIGAAVTAWPAVALIGSYELHMMVIRNSQVQADDRSGRPFELLAPPGGGLLAEDGPPLDGFQLGLIVT
jgi:hypothetical protein